MYVIICANLKGGVAKSTTTIQLGHYLAKDGKRVLVIDGDPDRCATEALGIDGPKSIYDVLTEPAEGIARAVVPYTGTSSHPISYPGCIDVIPGSAKIMRAPAAFDKTVQRQPVAAFENVPYYLFKTFCQGYDYVLLDPSPSRDRLTDTLLFGADGAIAPVSPETMPTRGVINLLRILKESNEERATFRIPGETRLLGIVISKIIPGEEADAAAFMAKLVEKRIPHFDTMIPYSAPVHQSPGVCLPVAEYAPQDVATAKFTQLGQELEARI